MKEQKTELETRIENETLVRWGGERDPVYMTAEQAIRYIEICKDSDID